MNILNHAKGVAWREMLSESGAALLGYLMAATLDEFISSRFLLVLFFLKERGQKTITRPQRWPPGKLLDALTWSDGKVAQRELILG